MSPGHGPAGPAHRSGADWSSMENIDPTVQLRGAVHRGDAAAIVALLHRTGPAEYLQPGGDGLVVALAQHAEGAATAAGREPR